MCQSVFCVSVFPVCHDATRVCHDATRVSQRYPCVSQRYVCVCHGVSCVCHSVTCVSRALHGRVTGVCRALPVCVRLCLSSWERLAKALSHEVQLKTRGFWELGEGPG